MDSTTSISVRVGKAVLTRSGLYVKNFKADIQDSSHFQSFVLSTQAIVVRALARLFPDDLGQLAKGNSGLQLEPGVAPWDQYAQASISLNVIPESSEIIVGWCVLLTLINMVSGGKGIDPKAALVASYIGAKGSAVMHVDPEELRQWLAWKSAKNLFADPAEQLRHEDLKPADPFRHQVAIAAPWVEQAGLFSPVDFAITFYGDVILDRKNRVAMVCVDRNFAYGQFHSSEILPEKLPEGHFSLNLVHNGADIRFRAYTYSQDRAVLRLLPRSIFQIGESQ